MPDECAIRQLPNFFLLGAGRCGTTTLQTLLASHPQVFMSRPKEPTFFIRKPTTRRSSKFTKGPIDYLDCFTGADGAVAIGDASHAYLSAPEAAPALKAYVPHARFVAIFRNPADRAYSLYRWMRNRGHEIAPTFELALKLEDRRFSSERFRRNPPQYFWNSMYFRSGLFGSQLDRYFSLFPRERFHFTTLSDLTRATATAMASVYSHLGLDPYPITSAPRTSQATNARYTRNGAHYLARHGVRGIAELEEAIFAKKSGRRIPAPKPETRAALIDRYSEDLRLFESITGISL